MTNSVIAPYPKTRENKLTNGRLHTSLDKEPGSILVENVFPMPSASLANEYNAQNMLKASALKKGLRHQYVSSRGTVTLDYDKDHRSYVVSICTKADETIDRDVWVYDYANDIRTARILYVDQSIRMSGNR